MTRRLPTYRATRPGDWLFVILGAPLALVSGAYALAILYAGVLLSLTVLGLPFVALALGCTRAVGGFHRRLLVALLGADIPAPAPRPRPEGFVARVRALLGDPVAWRALLYLLIRIPVGLLGLVAGILPAMSVWFLGFPLWMELQAGGRQFDWQDILAVALGAVLVVVAPAAVRGVSRANRALGRALLAPVKSQQRVRDLETARATLLSQDTDQLRRLERDLHDGAQARLVALAITLSMADESLGTDDGPVIADPARIRTLLDRARNQTETTITELRRLTQGINPVALDGGLAEALPSLADTAAVPVAIRLDLRERPDPLVERAVYFCAAELLTNVAKHSGARSAEITARAADGTVRLTVRDDGHGGAEIKARRAASEAAGPGAGPGERPRPASGTGLAGLAERLAAVDGTLRIDSPPGGPTLVTAELPAHL